MSLIENLNWGMTFEILKSMSIILASGVAIYGINSWRRETKWKKKYELAEEVLSCFYEISEAFDFIRDPAGYEGEGSSREQKPDESTEETERLNNAYVVIERYQKVKSPFNKLKTLKFRFMVLYGKDSEEPFMEINQLVNRLFIASQRLGNRYWKDQGKKFLSKQKFEKHIEQMHLEEAIFWRDYNEDEFKSSVDKAIDKIETICQNILEKV